RPPGLMPPGATSATLGDKNDPSRILAFARTVFGEDFGEDAVVTESRYSVEEWAELPGAELTGGRKRLALIDNPSSIDLAAALQGIENGLEETDEAAAMRALATIFHLDDHDDVTGADPRQKRNGMRSSEEHTSA